MTEPADPPADAPADPAADPDDAMLARLDVGEPPASAEEAAARRPYERLLADLRDLDDVEPPPGWLGRLEERRHREGNRNVHSAAPPRRRLARAIAVAAAGSALLAAAVVMTCRERGGARDRADTARLAMALRAADGAARRGDGMVGDTLDAAAVLDRAHGELRVYRDTTLIARCPGDAACRRAGARVTVAVRLAEPGEYRALALVADAPIPPPGPGGLDGDLLDARRAGVTIERRDAITVAP